MLGRIFVKDVMDRNAGEWGAEKWPGTPGNGFLGFPLASLVMDGGGDNLGERFSFTQYFLDNSEGSGLWTDCREC